MNPRRWVTLVAGLLAYCYSPPTPPPPHPLPRSPAPATS